MRFAALTNELVSTHGTNERSAGASDPLSFISFRGVYQKSINKANGRSVARQYDKRSSASCLIALQWCPNGMLIWPKRWICVDQPIRHLVS